MPTLELEHVYSTKSPRNKTLACTGEELIYYKAKIKTSIPFLTNESECINGIYNGDLFDIVPLMPTNFVDLLFLDPPYNLSKTYNNEKFLIKDSNEYALWFSKIIKLLKPVLKHDASIYVCSDWKTSIIIAPILQENFIIQNRITWERAKGRGAKKNWKNNMEDIWFCTQSNNYYFDTDSVKLKKRVIAPYKTNGIPKDWYVSHDKAYRMTYPSNIWTDISIPFWSMKENTNHPTQKPEKLLAKILLASSKKRDVILDPFLGSGTSAVVASKLDRKYVGIEIDTEYCCWALKRIDMTKTDTSIQGYDNGIFLERNSS